MTNLFELPVTVKWDYPRPGRVGHSKSVVVHAKVFTVDGPPGHGLPDEFINKELTLRLHQEIYGEMRDRIVRRFVDTQDRLHEELSHGPWAAHDAMRTLLDEVLAIIDEPTRKKP